MLTGCTNMAGELGHMTVVAGGRKCRCGNRGCLEAYVGGWAIAERARKSARDAPDQGARLVELGGSVAGITAETVHAARSGGDALATRLVEESADFLAAGLVGVVNAFNPCVLVLGGGIVQHAPLYVERARQHVSERALEAGARDLQVRSAALGDEAGAVGAATFARTRDADSTKAGTTG
jgi:glucokinase